MSGLARARRGAVALAATALLLALVAALTGCGTAQAVKAETYCFKAADATVRAVDLGMEVTGDLYRHGKVPEETVEKIAKVHDVYRPVAKTAVTGCKAVGTKGDADRVLAVLQEAADRILEVLVAVGVAR